MVDPQLVAQQRIVDVQQMGVLCGVSSALGVWLLALLIFGREEGEPEDVHFTFHLTKSTVKTFLFLFGVLALVQVVWSAAASY